MPRFKANLYFYKDIMNEEERQYWGQLVYDSKKLPRARFNIARNLSIDAIEEYCPDIDGELAILIPVDLVHDAMNCMSVQECRELVKHYVNNFRFDIIEDVIVED